jgi:hypothetical protein
VRSSEDGVTATLDVVTAPRGKKPASARRACVAMIVAASGLAACSLTSLDGLTSATGEIPDAARIDGTFEASPDAPAADARSDTTLVDAGDEAGVNLYPKGGTLESSCDPFVGYQGTVAPTSTAHGGSLGGCRACTGPGTTDYFTADDGTAFGLAASGERFRARLWVRTEVGKPAPPTVSLHIRTVLFPGFNVVSDETSPSVPIDATWKQLEIVSTLAKASNLNVFVSAIHAPGACFVIDDVTLERLP